MESACSVAAVVTPIHGTSSRPTCLPPITIRMNIWNHWKPCWGIVGSMVVCHAALTRVSAQTPGATITPDESGVLPSVPSAPPSTPVVPGYPSIPSTPGVPGYPSIPSTPGVPGYPNIPSTPSAPGTADTPNALWAAPGELDGCPELPVPDEPAAVSETSAPAAPV